LALILLAAIHALPNYPKRGGVQIFTQFGRPFQCCRLYYLESLDGRKVAVVSAQRALSGWRPALRCTAG
jgi:hypothetical protein